MKLIKDFYSKLILYLCILNTDFILIFYIFLRKGSRFFVFQILFWEHPKNGSDKQYQDTITEVFAGCMDVLSDAVVGIGHTSRTGNQFER